MLVNESEFVPEITPVCPDDKRWEELLFFDIETTGLQAQSSYVYLIGAAYFQNNAWHLWQLMTTDPSEEKELLQRFFALAKGFSALVQFNGTTFDLPFLEKKARRHCLASPLSSMDCIDLYRVAMQLKSILPTENLKLKTLEALFGLTRNDTFSGGELIDVYSHFLGIRKINQLSHSKQEEETALTHVLLLHNAEDVKNLPSLTFLALLSRPSLLAEGIADAFANEDGLTLVLSCPVFFKKDVLLSLCPSCPGLSLTLAADGRLFLHLPFYHGTLAHFYPNYKDYYYLPAEDCAIHKSIASFVDKDHRTRATLENCYTKSEGCFLPCFFKKGSKKEAGMESSFLCFQNSFKDVLYYTPYSEDFTTDASKQLLLCRELLQSLLTPSTVR